MHTNIIMIQPLLIRFVLVYFIWFPYWPAKPPFNSAAVTLCLLHSPEENAKYISNEQHQTDSCWESLSVIGPLDVLVLGDVGHRTSKHHHARSQPGEQSPWALHVLLWSLLHCLVLHKLLSVYSHTLQEEVRKLLYLITNIESAMQCSQD